MERDKITHIQLRVETRERLKDLGKKGETYDEIITRLLNHYLKHREES